MSDAEKRIILQVLQEARWNRKRAADRRSWLETKGDQAELVE